MYDTTSKPLFCASCHCLTASLSHCLTVSLSHCRPPGADGYVSAIPDPLLPAAILLWVLGGVAPA
eukprot:8886467-Pyramimonas_sp.AAC.1